MTFGVELNSLPHEKLFYMVRHMENHLTSLDSAFHALSDPTRRAVIHRLMTGPAPVKALARPFDMGLPSFLKHLKVLEDSGLVTSEKVGRVRTCRIRAETLTQAEDWLVTQRRLWEGRMERLADYVENELSGNDRSATRTRT